MVGVTTTHSGVTSCLGDGLGTDTAVLMGSGLAGVSVESSRHSRFDKQLLWSVLEKNVI